MVTELIKQEGSYLDILRDLHSAQRATNVEWLNKLRNTAMERFSELGFPSVKDEEWKYTNVAPIARMSIQPRAASADLELANFEVPEAKQSQLVFVNGKLQSDRSSVTALPDGVIAIDLVEACGSD